MQAILNVKMNEIDDNFLHIIKELLSKKIEVIIRKDIIELEEFDNTIPLENIMKHFSKESYNKDFLIDLEEGFKSSTVYSEAIWK